MSEFVELIAAFPAVIFTALPGVLPGVVAAGHPRRLGDGVDSEPDADGALDDIGDALGISSVPPAIGLSIISFVGWVVSLAVTAAVRAADSAGSGSRSRVSSPSSSPSLPAFSSPGRSPGEPRPCSSPSWPHPSGRRSVPSPGCGRRDRRRRHGLARRDRRHQRPPARRHVPGQGQPRPALRQRCRSPHHRRRPPRRSARRHRRRRPPRARALALRGRRPGREEGADRSHGCPRRHRCRRAGRGVPAVRGRRLRDPALPQGRAGLGHGREQDTFDRCDLLRRPHHAGGPQGRADGHLGQAAADRPPGQGGPDLPRQHPGRHRRELLRAGQPDQRVGAQGGQADRLRRGVEPRHDGPALRGQVLRGAQDGRQADGLRRALREARRLPSPRHPDHRPGPQRLPARRRRHRVPRADPARGARPAQHPRRRGHPEDHRDHHDAPGRHQRAEP